MQELLGAPVAKALTADLADRVVALSYKGIKPKLAIVRLGENAGDLAYERGALSRMAKVGVEVDVHALPLDTTQSKLEYLLGTLSGDASVHGILMMRPLPKGLDESAAQRCVCATKDVDGMTTGSLAKVFSGKGEGYAPCTAEAVIRLLDYYNIDVAGKHVAVLGRSLVIGKPVAQLLLAKNATVTTCHSKTANLADICKSADIIVSCMGQAHMLTDSYISAGSTVVDVSTNDNGEGGITGDVDPATVQDLDIALTPVPRGVGSVTTSVLAAHVVESAERSAIL